MGANRHATETVVPRGRPLLDICDAAVVTDAGEPDVQSRLVAVRWDHAIPLDDRRVRIVALMGTAPPARVEVVDRPASVAITLFERRPLLYDRLLIGITASFEILLPTALHGRRLIDGVTGFDPSTVKRRGRVGEGGSCVEVPIGRTFDWRELTGRPWFDVELSDDEPIPPVARAVFPSDDVPPRERPEGG